MSKLGEYRVFNDAEDPVTEAEAVDAAIACANGRVVVLGQRSNKDAPRHTDDACSRRAWELLAYLAPHLDSARTPRPKPTAATALPTRMYWQLVMERDDRSGRVLWRPYAQFEDATGVVNYGLMLAGDPNRPFYNTIGVCKNCREVYRVRGDRKGSKGGRPNRTFCSPECREAWRDGAERGRLRRLAKSSGESA